MWVVKGKTVNGVDVQYKVPAGKDTDKAYVLALAFQDHGRAVPDDALTAETTVTWTSDNVLVLPEPVVTLHRENFGVDKRVRKGVWERHFPRAYRTIEAATEALESAASEFPNDHFRIVQTTTTSQVVSISKNGLDAKVVEEVPDKEDLDQIKGQEAIVDGDGKPAAKPKATRKSA